MNSAIRIKSEIREALLRFARYEPQYECCGLLAGKEGAITHVFKAANAAAEPMRNYEIAPVELFRLIREIRKAGLDMLGIYHSHPKGRNEPSERDVERAYYSDVAYFIASPLPDAPNPVRAFAISNGDAVELGIEMY